MRTLLNAVTFGFAFVGVMFVCHNVGQFGMKQSVNDLLVAANVFLLGGLGISGMITTFFETE